MARPNKRKLTVKKMVQDRESRHKIRKVQDAVIGTREHKRESSPELEESDVIPTGLVPMGTDSEFDDLRNDDEIVGEREELQQLDESEFARPASAAHELRCVQSL